MGHRQLYFSSHASNMGCEDIWNHPYPDPHLHLGTTAIGVNPVPYFDVTLRSNSLPSPNLCMEIPNHPNHGGRVNPGNLHDLFPHPSSVNNSNQMPPNYIQGGPSCYDGFGINSHMDYERTHQPYKRKTPAIPMAFDSGNNFSYHGAGTSSNLSVSSVNVQPNHAAGPQYVAWDPNGMPSSYRGNNMLSIGEASHRNVRSRQSHALHLGNNRNGAHQLSNLPPHLHPAPNISGLTASDQWGQTPASSDYNRRIMASGAGNFSHEVNRTLANNNGTSSSMEIDGEYHRNPHQNRISSTPLPIPHPPLSQIVSASHSSYDQRTHSFRCTSSYQPVAFSAPVAEVGRPGIDVVPPRYSRPLSNIGRSSDRGGRSRVLYDRFQPFSYGNHAPHGWISEERAFYDPRNFLDQHRDMRLDIDDMSYEELLALGERIGNVNTGLSGDTIPKCLVEIIYDSSNQQDNQAERNCVICLEEYQDKENLGRLSCGHDFHFNCITKWLSVKNACPICKAAALPDSFDET